jgi:hypothetical protein
MSSTQNVFEWLVVLFVVTGLFLVLVRARDYWHSRFSHAVVETLPAEPDQIPNQDHRFSLRRLK